MLVLTRKFGEEVLIEDRETGRSLIVAVRRAHRRTDAVQLTFQGDREMHVSRIELLSPEEVVKRKAVRKNVMVSFTP